MRTVLRNALLILALLLAALAAVALLGEDPRTLPFAYEGVDPS